MARWLRIHLCVGILVWRPHCLGCLSGKGLVIGWKCHRGQPDTHPGPHRETSCAFLGGHGSMENKTHTDKLPEGHWGAGFPPAALPACFTSVSLPFTTWQNNPQHRAIWRMNEKEEGTQHVLSDREPPSFYLLASLPAQWPGCPGVPGLTGHTLVAVADQQC